MMTLRGYIICCIVLAFTILTSVRSATPPPTQPATALAGEIDYQKTADNTAWNPHSATVLSYWPGDQGKYTVCLEVASDDKVTFSILLNKTLMYKWDGHLSTIFDISGNKLYWIDYLGSSPGGTVVAVDLTTGTVEWRSKLRGVVAGNHSGYGNRIAIDVGRDTIAVWGDEDAGRYVEIKRLSDGVTVGHHIYDDPSTKPSEASAGVNAVPLKSLEN